MKNLLLGGDALVGTQGVTIQGVSEEEVLAGLRARLSDGSWEVRREACREVGQRFAKEPDLMGQFLPEITELLNDSFVLVRREAIRTLGKAGPLAKPYVGALLECLQKENDCYGRAEIVRALEEIGLNEDCLALARLVSESKEASDKERKAAARAIARIVESSR